MRRFDASVKVPKAIKLDLEKCFLSEHQIEEGCGS